MAGRSKALVCGLLPTETEGSNPTGGLDVCLDIVVYCQVEVSVKWWSLVPTAVSCCVWSRNLVNEEAIDHVGPQLQNEN